MPKAMKDEKEKRGREVEKVEIIFVSIQYLLTPRRHYGANYHQEEP